MPDDIPVDDAPQVAPEPQPGAGFATVSPDAYGGQVGQALQGVGGTAMHYARMEQRYHDSEAVSGALTDVGQAHLQLLRGPNGILSQNLQGQALHEGVDKALSDFDAQTSAIGQNLGNDRQRAMFERETRAQRYSLQNTLQTYEVQQGNKQAVSTLTNGNKILQQQAAQLPDQPAFDPDTDKPINRVDQSISQQQKNIADTGQHLGWTPEQIQETQAKAANDTTAAVLQGMLAPGQDSQRAADFYEKRKGDLFPAEQDRFGAAVDRTVTQQKAGAIAHGLMYDEQGQIRPQADVLNDMAKNPDLIDNEKLSTEVERQVGRTYRLKKSADTETENNRYDAVNKYLYGDGNGDVAQVPSDIWQALTPQHREDLMRQGKNIQENKFAPDGSDTFYGLSAMAGKDPSQFANVDLRQYRSGLSSKDYGDLITLQRQASGKEAAHGLNVASTREELLKGALQTLGPVGQGYKENPDQIDLRRKVDLATEAAGGLEKIGTAGLQKIVDQMTVQVHTSTPGRVFGNAWPNQTDTPYFKTLPSGYAFAPSQIPGDTRAHVVDLLRQRGIVAPTSEQILNTYNGGLTNANPGR